MIRPLVPCLLLLMAGLPAADSLVGSTVSGGSRRVGDLELLDTLGDVVGGASGLESGLLVRTAGNRSLPRLVPTQTPARVAAGSATALTWTAEDPDGGPVAVDLVTGPVQGTVTELTARGALFTVPAQAGGPVTMTLAVTDDEGSRVESTVSVVIQADQTRVRAFVPGRSAPYQFSQGTPVSIAIVGGQGPWSWSTTAGQITLMGPLPPQDVDGDGQVDTGALARLDPGVVGTGTVTIRDAVARETTVEFTVTAVAPAPAVPAPVVPVSSRTQTVFGSLGTQTPEGGDSLLAAFRTASAREVVGYVWDGVAQAFVQLPSTPTGDLAPDQGVFIAARIALPVDFAGTPTMTPAGWTIHPGWNFLAVPLLRDGTNTPIAAVVTSADLTLREVGGTELTGVERSAVFSGTWWAFDGQSYVAVTTLEPGRAYWVRNRSSSPARPLVMSITPGVGARSARSTEHARPPLPPAAQRAESGGSCGAGSGIAFLVAGLAFLGFRGRSRSK